MRTKVFLITLLVLLMAMSFAYAAGTAAGTVISNYATGTYKDANGNALSGVQSNTVTTTVTQVAGVDISPASSSSTMANGGTVSFPMTLTNTGNGTDTFDLSQVDAETGGGNNTVEIYYDADGNGVVDGGESTVSATSALAADALYHIVVVVTNVSGADASYTTVTLTATSQFNASVDDDATAVATVTSAILAYSLTADDQTPQPGDVVTYTISGNNTGTAEARNVIVTAPIPGNVTYVTGSLTYGGAARTDGDGDDNSDYNVTTAGAVTFDMGTLAASGSGSMTFQVAVNAGVPSGTIVTPTSSTAYKNTDDVAQTAVNASNTNGILTIDQLYAVIVGADASDSGDPSDYVHYVVTVQNTGNASDDFTISASSTLIGTWTFYFDTNSNGSYDSGTDVALTSSKTGSMAQNATVTIIARGQIPAGTADATTNVMTLTATSVGSASVNDDGELTITVTAPVLALTKSVSPTGNQPPGTTLTYTVAIANSGTGEATTIVITDVVPTNTTYQAGTMKIGGVAKTDDSDSDGATLSGSSVIFDLSTISAGGSQTVSFQTKIN